MALITKIFLVLERVIQGVSIFILIKMYHIILQTGKLRQASNIREKICAL